MVKNVTAANPRPDPELGALLDSANRAEFREHPDAVERLDCYLVLNYVT